jgi:hypothetical protein
MSFENLGFKGSFPTSFNKGKWEVYLYPEFENEEFKRWKIGKDYLKNGNLYLR